MASKIEKLEDILRDLNAGKIKRAQAERLSFTDINGNQVRLTDSDAAAKLAERIEAERTKVSP